MHITTSDEIVELLKSKEIDFRHVYFGDDEYLCPSLDWIKVKFAKSWEKYKFNNKIGKYIVGKRDCDNFALGANFWIKELHQKDKATSDILADLAFGEIYYTRDIDMQGHAINVFFYYNEGGNLTMGFFEPQNSKIVELTKDEIESIFFFRL